MTLSNGRTSAYQWDYGLAVVTADTDGTKVRIANEHGSKAFVVEAEDGVYKIPDVLLTTGRAVVLYHLAGDTDTTLYATSEEVLPVYEAPKPDDYIYTEEELRVWKELDDRLTDAEETIVQHTGEIAGLTSAVSQNTANIAQHSSAIATNTGNISQNTANIAQNASDINALESSVNALDTDVDTLANDVNALETDVNALETGKISDPTTKSTGQYLSWNGSAWVAASLPQEIFTITLDSNWIPTNSYADIKAAGDAGQYFVITSLGDYYMVTEANLDVDVGEINAFLPSPGLSVSLYLEYFEGTWTASHNRFNYIDNPSQKSDGDVLTYDRATTSWVSRAPSSGSTDYDDLTDKPQINSVTLSGNKSSSDLGLADAVHTHSQYLTQETDPTVPSWAKQTTKPTYTASEVGAIPVPPTGLGDFLRWNQSADQWVRSAISASDVGAMPAPHSDYSPSDGEVIVYNGTQNRWDVVPPEDSGLIPTPSSPSAGDVLTYDSTDGWVASPLSASDVGAIPLPSSASSGQFLSWNGSAWVATSLPIWNGGVT